jgi:small subunit ribosomal protein S21
VRHDIEKREVGVCVVARQHESTQELIKRFKKKYSKSGLVQELKGRMSYTKPSISKRLKSQAARRLRELEERKKQDRLRKFRRLKHHEVEDQE